MTGRVAADFVASVLAKEVSKSAGQDIIVESTSAEGGKSDTNEAMRAPTHGYTLMLSSPGQAEGELRSEATAPVEDHPQSDRIDRTRHAEFVLDRS